MITPAGLSLISHQAWRGSDRIALADPPAAEDRSERRPASGTLYVVPESMLSDLALLVRSAVKFFDNIESSKRDLLRVSHEIADVANAATFWGGVAVGALATFIALVVLGMMAALFGWLARPPKAGAA